MDQETLRRLVEEQVRRALAAAAPATVPGAPPEGPTVVAAFCGGRGGLATALEQVRALGEYAHVVAVFSPAAKEIIGLERLTREARAHEVVLPEDARPSALVHRAEVVAVAQLTRTTLARLALGLSESAVTSMVLHALWGATPVIVAKDGVDPDLAACEECGTGVDVPRELVRLYDGYLERIAAFGCHVIPAAQLAATARVLLEGGEPGTHRPLRVRRVITEQDVRRAARRGESLKVAGAIVTPLARDTARELGVGLIEE